jgi:hypothetical protein
MKTLKSSPAARSAGNPEMRKTSFAIRHPLSVLVSKRISISAFQSFRLAALFVALLAFASTGWGQTAFSGVYSFSGATGNTTSLAYNGSAISNLSISAITKNGVTNSSSPGNFRASGWGTGSTNNGTIGGTLDPTKYFEFTITASSGFALSNPSLNFGVGRSATGPRQFEWRTSVDNFATPMSVGITNANVTNASNVLQIGDVDNNYTGNNVSITSSGNSSITFRFYAYGAETAAGTGGLAGNLTFNATITATSSTQPTITSFSPTSGLVGDSITINGTNFASNAAVSFNGTLAAPPTVNPEGTSIDVTVPSGATTGPITVTVGSESATSATAFTVINPLAPVLSTTGNFTAFSANLGNASDSQSISVNGTNLNASITATSPTGFEVSSDNSTYGSTATIAPTGGPLFARIASTATAGALTGNITLASTGATSLSLPVSGTVTAPPSVPISITPGATISENFSSLGNVSTATLPSGWKVDKNTTARLVGSYAGAGTATERAAGADMSTGAFNGIYNFGSSPTDRAVGGLSSTSASKSVNLYAALENTSASSISQLFISYNAERYRNGSNTAGFAIQLHYSTDGSSWTSAGNDFLSAFAANADNTGSAIVPIETLAVTSAVLPVAIPAGSTLYLAWNYSVTTGTTTSNAQALGVSDISITASGGATPAPVVADGTIAGTVGAALSYSINATNSPTSYGNITALPTGLSLNATTGAITGTPTTAGNLTTTVTATNSGGTGTGNLTFVIAPSQVLPFDTWTGGNVTMTPAILQTYAIGGGNYNGAVAPQVPVTTVASGNLTLTAIVRTDDPALTVIGEHNTDLTLGTWTSLGNGTATADQNGVPAGNERRAFSTPADGTKKFLRLRADYAQPN